MTQARSFEAVSGFVFQIPKILKWTPGVRHEVKGVIAVRCKSVAGEVAVDPLWKHLSGG
jgi:hypothetical protein